MKLAYEGSKKSEQITILSLWEEADLLFEGCGGANEDSNCSLTESIRELNRRESMVDSPSVKVSASPSTESLRSEI